MRARFTAVVFGSGLALGAAGGFLLGGRLAPRGQATSATASAADEQVPASTSRVVRAARAPGPDLREAIRASVDRVIAEHRRGVELELYLEALERTARKRGEVTALEVVPGLAAIDAAYPGDLERGPAFSRRMEALARQLGQSASSDDEPPAGVAPLALVQAIAKVAPGPERDKLVPQALTAISRLPLEEQEEASRALDRATAQGSPPPTVASPDELLASLATTRDTATRERLVRAFLDAASALPVDEQERRFKELDRVTAAPPH